MPVSKLAFWALLAIAPLMSVQTIDLPTPHRVKLEPVTYLGKPAVQIVEDGDGPNGEAYAVVKGVLFHNGAIDAGWRASRRRAPPPLLADSMNRLASSRRPFRAHLPAPDQRPGRWDRVRRNHSTQYSPHLDFSFARLQHEALEKV